MELFKYHAARIGLCDSMNLRNISRATIARKSMKLRIHILFVRVSIPMRITYTDAHGILGSNALVVAQSTTLVGSIGVLSQRNSSVAIAPSQSFTR